MNRRQIKWWVVLAVWLTAAPGAWAGEELRKVGIDMTEEFPITAAAFGDIYDMSDGGKATQNGGDAFKDIVCGDTWYSTWAGDDTCYMIHDDGTGFNNVGGLFARHRLCRLDGNPNVSTASFFGVNLNPGLLGETMPSHEVKWPEKNAKEDPELLWGYSSSVYEQDGVIYVIRHHWSSMPHLWPPIDSCLVKSSDGGKTWINHLGQTNAPLLPPPEQAQFPVLPWSWMTFIQYGQGGAAPEVDNAKKYVYLTASDHLARVPRDRLARLDRNDFEFYRGAGLDGLLESSWSKEANEGKPVGKINLANVVYDFALQCYVGAGSGYYVSPSAKSKTGSGHDIGKTRHLIYVAKHPWGPWKEVVHEGIWGIAGWNMLFCNKYTTPDGKKMWWAFCGEYQGDTWNYGLQYRPVYLSGGAVDIYEAEKAKLTGLSVGSSYPSHSGSGYVEGFAKAGDKATFELKNINGTGWHIVRIRYSSPKINAANLSVYVNGKKVRRIKLSLNNCDYQRKEDWVDGSGIYYLNQGENRFEICQDKGDEASGVLIDYIAVSREATHNEGRNVAPEAKATASSGPAANANTGCVDGIKEWAAQGTVGEWIKLDWSVPQTVHKVVLYDLVNMSDQVTAGTLFFSDGTSVAVGKLQNDGQAGTVVTFAAKKITWVKFTVDQVRAGTQHGGLGGMEVYGD